MAVYSHNFVQYKLLSALMSVIRAGIPFASPNSCLIVGSVPSLTGIPGIRNDVCSISTFSTYNTGNRLAIGSTTGGFWTSDDEGDTWAALPARLPPVHAVAFA